VLESHSVTSSVDSELAGVEFLVERRLAFLRLF
jgi:hypothetical protein